MHDVVLYSRSGCHLCDEAREVLAGVRERLPFTLREIDIEADDELVRDYGIRVPVVSIDGVERFETSVDRAELAEILTV